MTTTANGVCNRRPTVILKLNLTAEQLSKLHACLEDPGNFWEHGYRPDQSPEKRSFVWIKSVRAAGSAKGDIPVPHYMLTLEVATSYQGRRTRNYILTPLAHLTHVLHAIGLFPVEDGQPIP
jgi:hypothetical protein